MFLLFLKQHTSSRRMLLIKYKTRETYRKVSLDAKLCLLFGTYKEKAEKLQKGVLRDF